MNADSWVAFVFWVVVVSGIGMFGGILIERDFVADRSCYSACERRGTETRLREADTCVCEDSTVLRLDRGRGWR